MPSGTGFYLQISGTPVAGLSPRQTVVQYVAFDSNNDAIAVNGISEAAEVFKGNDNTTFFSNDRFLGTATFTESVVQRFLDFPTGFAVWDIIGIFAHLRNTAGFCFENGLIYAYTDTDICENPINIIPTSKLIGDKIQLVIAYILQIHQQQAPQLARLRQLPPAVL